MPCESNNIIISILKDAKKHNNEVCMCILPMHAAKNTPRLK